MKVQHISVNRINPAPYNPRKDLKPEDSAYKGLVRSIDEFGCVVPLVWNKKTGNLVGGHQRFKILVARGEKHVTVCVVDLSPEKEKALNLALNRVGGEWDHERLTALLSELVTIPDFNIELTGFDLPDVARLLSDIPDNGGCDEHDGEAESASQGPTVTQPGELITLGQHRLLCGDATKPVDLEKLCGDRSPQLLLTDPPYNVSYTGLNRPAAPQPGVKPKGWGAIHGDSMSPKRYRSHFTDWAASVSDIMAPGSAFYVWNSHKNFSLMYDILSRYGLVPAQVITWAKESFAPGFSDYNEQTEFCLYGWKRGARHRFYGPMNTSTLWQERRERNGRYEHPTQKPIALFERAIRYSTKPGDLVLDTYLGSGTTLIAAARLGRCCFGTEIEPRFCDVVVRRYIALVGESVVAPGLVDRYRHQGGRS